MALPTEKGISPFTGDLTKWLQQLVLRFPRIETFAVSLTPASVAATSASAQNFTIPGLRTGAVSVNPPDLNAGLSIDYVQATTDTLTVVFRNHTGSGLTPAAGIYYITQVRL